MKNYLFDTISDEEYEQVRQAGNVLYEFLKRHYKDFYYTEVVISWLGNMTIRKEETEWLLLDKTKEECKKEKERLLSEVPF